jgi:hypothetical protein
MTGSPENYKGQYASLKFDPYKHREFPKAVYVDGVLVGTANNLLEEKELYASRGIERGDIDPMSAARDEIAELKAKLAQFESGQPAVGRSVGVQTNTVSMLPAGVPQKMGPGDGVAGDNVTPEHLEDSPRGANPTYNPPPGGDPARNAVPKPGATSTNPTAEQAQATGSPEKQQQSVSTGTKPPNPLLVGKPGAQGTAPQVNKPLESGT